MPTTLLGGRPEAFCSAQTMASSGLVMQITKASGACVAMPLPTASMTLRLMPSRSSRLMPGLARHAGRDDHHVGAGDVLVVVDADELGSRSLRPARIRRGRAPCPAACLRGCRTATTSPSSFSPTRWARVPPIWPAPIRAIFLRAMIVVPNPERVRRASAVGRARSSSPNRPLLQVRNMSTISSMPARRNRVDRACVAAVTADAVDRRWAPARRRVSRKGPPCNRCKSRWRGRPSGCRIDGTREAGRRIRPGPRRRWRKAGRRRARDDAGPGPVLRRKRDRADRRRRRARAAARSGAIRHRRRAHDRTTTGARDDVRAPVCRGRPFLAALGLSDARCARTAAIRSLAHGCGPTGPARPHRPASGSTRRMTWSRAAAAAPSARSWPAPNSTYELFERCERPNERSAPVRETIRMIGPDSMTLTRQTARLKLSRSVRFTRCAASCGGAGRLGDGQACPASPDSIDGSMPIFAQRAIVFPFEARVEDQARVGGAVQPAVGLDLRFELPRRPARVAQAPGQPSSGPLPSAIARSTSSVAVSAMPSSIGRVELSTK